MKEVKVKLPIGVENFEDMIKQGYYYVDKTLMIKDLLDKGGSVNLFTRPRRFGKTLNMSMLQHYFENLKQTSADLFKGLKIEQTGKTYLAHQNKYPVIKLSLKEASKKTFEESLAKLVGEVSREFIRHDELLDADGFTVQQKEKYKRIRDEKGTQKDYEDSLKFLSGCLEQYYNEKVIILIDEYDVPLEKAYFAKQPYYEEMVDFIRSFFSSGLKTNDALNFSVITGCLRVSKEDIFTGLDNLNIVSILTDNYGEYFGFLESEVENMLIDCGIPEKLAEMRDWYNGYLFGETVVYNPWSSIKYLSDVIYGKMPFPVAHWSNTSSNSVIKKLIALADDETKDEIELLIQGETLKKRINEDIVYGDVLKSMDNLWNFLYFTGYLKKVSKVQIGVHHYFELKIPNKEIQYIYERQIMEWFDERVKETDRSRLYHAILTQDVEIFEDELIRLLGETISYMDSHENFYHGFLTGILQGMNGYVAKSNRESGNGRGDLFLRPRDMRKPAIVIEIKVADKLQQLPKESLDALHQIKEKQYVKELEEEGFSHIMKYGVAFYRKMCMIKISSLIFQ
ncbi:MAG: ATP-binding protein [Defluviitaleaceae bacterium]|nr:ATP-binding protein [Defluviitaleaceae bacterium]